MSTVRNRRTTRRVVGLLASIALGTGALAAAPAAFAADPPRTEGPTITANASSPTGYTVTFVYENPDATQVRLAGDLTLLGLDSGTTRYQPEAWQPGRYHSGGTEFLRDMTKDADGYWSVSLPLHAGAISYWYRVWDPTRGWENKRIWDPASTDPRPPGENSFRVRNNDVLDAVRVPYSPKQADPVLEARARYELPATDRGSVQYVEYTTILGDDGHHLGVYLPPGYDPDRAEPYKVVYLAHGIFGDETDFMVPASVPNILDNMTARGEIEPTVAITMGNHFTGDGLNFASYNQQNAADNLVRTILPFVEERYNVADEREGRAYGGFSYGGMTGGVVMRTYPTTFGYYGHFSGNPSLSEAQYDAVAGAVGTNGMSVFLGNGIFEGPLDRQNAIAESFRSRGVPAATAQVPGAHDGMTAGQLFTLYARDHLWKNADARDGIPVEAVIPEGEDGVLAMTVADFGDAVRLSAPENIGDRLRLTGDLPEVTVSDSRTAAQAGQGGWAVSGQADAFTSSGQSLPATHLGWTPEVLTPRAGLVAGAPVSTVLDGGPGLATPSRLASADAQGRYGSATLGAALRLEVPVGTQPGTYTGMMTVSLFPVD
jgi:enterochelin esterase-like enzyme